MVMYLQREETGREIYPPTKRPLELHLYADIGRRVCIYIYIYMYKGEKEREREKKKRGCGGFLWEMLKGGARVKRGGGEGNAPPPNGSRAGAGR